jgi:hypothetical protein
LLGLGGELLLIDSIVRDRSRIRVKC